LQEHVGDVGGCENPDKNGGNGFEDVTKGIRGCVLGPKAWLLTRRDTLKKSDRLIFALKKLKHFH
jgi:hypothetical protein